MRSIQMSYFVLCEAINTFFKPMELKTYPSKVKICIPLTCLMEILVLFIWIYSLHFFRAVCRSIHSHSVFKLAVKFNGSFDSFKWQFTCNIPKKNIQLLFSFPFQLAGLNTVPLILSLSICRIYSLYLKKSYICKDPLCFGKFPRRSVGRSANAISMEYGQNLI